MASNAGKKGGRTTAKGTRPPAKKTGPTPKADAPAAAKGPQGAQGSPTNTVNRQMRRSGLVPESATNDEGEAQLGRMKLVLWIGGGVTLLAVLLCIVFFRLSGTWVGLLGAAAGLAAGLAVSTGRTRFADKGRLIAIILAAIGVVVTAIGVSGIVDVHWPFAALIGCGFGAAVSELSAQQMTPPESPPQAAIALLRRTGAQPIPAPSTGSSLWATPDGRIRVIVGASIGEGLSNEQILKDRNIRRSRQRGALVLRRMQGFGAEPGLTIVVDTGITTIRDGSDVICSAAQLNKVLSR